MPRKFVSPNLHKAIINIGKKIGIGQSDFNITKVRSAELIEGKNVFHGVFKKKPGVSRISVATTQSIYRSLKKLGLPVPEFSRALSILNKRKVKHPEIFAENLERKYGKLYDCHKKGSPIFLRKLNLKKDSELINNLAKDLATMHRNGIIPNYIDFWHFYKIGDWKLSNRGTWDRVIIDFDKMFRIPKKEIEYSEFIEKNLKHISRNMKKDVWKEFFRIYLNEMGKLL
jgi:hypothetical protein